MGHTNSTVNYNLPQFVGTDKPSWLDDVNGSFLAIDTAIAAAKTEADSAAGGVAGLQTTVGSHTTQIGTLTDTVTAQGGTLNSVTALIGNGTPTTTDKTIIGAINEINKKTVKVQTVTLTVNGSNGSASLSSVGDVNDIVVLEVHSLETSGTAWFMVPQAFNGSWSCRVIQISGGTVSVAPDTTSISGEVSYIER